MAATNLKLEASFKEDASRGATLLSIRYLSTSNSGTIQIIQSSPIHPSLPGLKSSLLNIASCATTCFERCQRLQGLKVRIDPTIRFYSNAILEILNPQEGKKKEPRRRQYVFHERIPPSYRSILRELPPRPILPRLGLPFTRPCEAPSPPPHHQHHRHRQEQQPHQRKPRKRNRWSRTSGRKESTSPYWSGTTRA